MKQMTKTLSFITTLFLTSSSLGSVGGDVLSCRSLDGSALFSNQQMTYIYEHTAPLPNGQSMKIPQAESVEITMLAPDYNEPRNMSVELNAEIKSRRHRILRSAETHIERIVAPVTDPEFLYKKEWTDQIDYGDFTYKTTLEVVELIYSPYISDVRERRESIEVTCYYHYFSTCGGSCR